MKLPERIGALALITLAALLVCTVETVAAEMDKTPELSRIDRIRLAEVFRIAGELQDRVWPGWSSDPLALLLVTADYEFLIWHPKPTDDFTSTGYDSLLQSEVLYRPRAFATNLQATFPAVGGVPTIVIGQAENTQAGKSTPWVMTVLHEHFHQRQYSDPYYYDQVESLDLTGGDKTGMWMLNYPFPYDSADVSERYSTLSHALSDLLETKHSPQFDEEVRNYLALRREFQNALSPADYRYFSFQAWQEGVARYTEWRMAVLAGGVYDPTKAFQSLPDFEPLAANPAVIRNLVTDRLRKNRLSSVGRVAFYSFGAAEAMLLERVDRDWQQRYLDDKFFLERYFPEKFQN